MRIKASFLRYFSALSILLGIFGSPLAQSQANSSSTSVPPSPAEVHSNFSLSTYVDYLTNMYRGNVFERQEEIDYTFFSNYQFNNDWNASAIIFVSQDTRNTQDSELADTFMAVTYKELEATSPEKTLILSGSLLGVVPTDQNSRVNQTFNGGLGFRESMALKFPQIFVPTTIILKEAFIRNFHVYDTAADGSYNVQYSLTSDLWFAFQLSQKMGLMLKTTYINGTAYSNSQTNAFLTDAILMYDLTKHVSVNAGISNHGDMLQPDGRDSNFNYFKDDSSQVHIGIGVNL